MSTTSHIALPGRPGLRSRLILVTTVIVLACSIPRPVNSQDGDHNDAEFRAAVLKSIVEVELSEQLSYRAPDLYKEAIAQWTGPEQREDQIKACDGLYLWRWAGMGFGLTSRRFSKCPKSWREEVWSSGTLPERISQDETLTRRLERICDWAMIQALRNGQRLSFAKRLTNCPAEWSRAWLAIDDHDYVPIFKIAPIMPDKAFRVCEAGWAMLVFDIGSNGRVKNARVVSSTHGMYERPSRVAVRQFLYLPRSVNGQFVETTDIQHKFSFEVDC